MRVAVVGHVEWVEFLPVEAAPRPGIVLHAEHASAEPAGGGGVAAVELARLAGACTLHTAVGEDAVGSGIAPAMASVGVSVAAAVRPVPHRRAITLIDPDGERTITVIGPSQALTDDEADPALFEGVDAVYFCKGGPAWVRAARRARVLVSTARELATLQAAGVQLDALVRSRVDPRETFTPGELLPRPHLVASTDGERGGHWLDAEGEGRWQATPLPGPVADAYGCGDCFAVGLTWGLAQGWSHQRALGFAAERGALALTRRGVGVAHPVP